MTTTYKVTLEVREIPANLVVVRAITEQGQVFAEVTKDITCKRQAIIDVTAYCIYRGWEVLDGD